MVKNCRAKFLFNFFATYCLRIYVHILLLLLLLLLVLQRPNEFHTESDRTIDMVYIDFSQTGVLIDKAGAWFQSGSGLINEAAAWFYHGGCLIDQAAAWFLSGSGLINQAAAWFYQAAPWPIEPLPDLDQAAA